MRNYLLISLFTLGLPLAGCGAVDDLTAAGVEEQELSSYAHKLAGAYVLDKNVAPIFGFRALILKSNGSYVAKKSSTSAEQGSWSISNTQLRLGQRSFYYQTTKKNGLVQDLYLNDGHHFTPQVFSAPKSRNYCDRAQDCAGQLMGPSFGLCATLCTAQHSCETDCLP